MTGENHLRKVGREFWRARFNEWLADKNIARSLDSEQKRNIVSRVAEDLITDIKEIVSILPLSLIATIYVQEGSEPLTELAIQNKAAEYLSGSMSHNAILGFDEENIVAEISIALKILTARKVLTKEKGFFSANPASQKFLYYLHNSKKHLLFT